MAGSEKRRRQRIGIVYKITFPNGKIYVGSDHTNTFRYFGSWNPEYVRADDKRHQMRTFRIKREILWGPTMVSKSTLTSKEHEFIAKFRSHLPSRGYNLSPKGPIGPAVVFKIQFPNGKVFIGSDSVVQLGDFGKWDSEQVRADLKPHQRRGLEIERTILWRSKATSGVEIRRQVKKWIRQFRSDEAQHGYNQ